MSTNAQGNIWQSGRAVEDVSTVALAVGGSTDGGVVCGHNIVLQKEQRGPSVCNRFDACSLFSTLMGG